MPEGSGPRSMPVWHPAGAGKRHFAAEEKGKETGHGGNPTMNALMVKKGTPSPRSCAIQGRHASGSQMPSHHVAPVAATAD